jgi:hypothetical protein
VDVPNTGGWQNWQSVSMNGIQLAAGVHVYQVQFFYGQFNYNYTEFIQTSVGVEDPNEPVREFGLMQNYPNPFNPDTNIRYTVPHEGIINIKLYDILGNEISELQNSKLPAGEYNLRLNADDLNLSSGVYIYQVSFNNTISISKKALFLK